MRPCFKMNKKIIKKIEIIVVLIAIIVIIVFFIANGKDKKNEIDTEKGEISSQENTEILQNNDMTEIYLQTTEAIEERNRSKVLNKTDQADAIGAEAIAQYNNYKILPSVIVAKAMFESGFGIDEVAACVNNYFNLEYKSDCGTKYQLFTFGESSDLKDDDTQKSEYTVAYRKYDSPKESVDDYEKYISESIPKLVGEQDYMKACKLIDKQNADELVRLIEQYQYDQKYDSSIKKDKED